jgi:hypothetical protein
VFSSMCLGVPFIAPRQLGAVESNSGRPFLPSVVGCTGHVRCTPDSPVPPSDRWPGHVSRADSAADRWPGRPLAHRTVRCTPDSPMNFSRTSSANSQERPLHAESAWRTGHCPVHHWTLSGAPPDSPVLPDSVDSWLLEPRHFQLDLSCFQHLDTIH